MLKKIDKLIRQKLNTIPAAKPNVFISSTNAREIITAFRDEVEAMRDDRVGLIKDLPRTTERLELIAQKNLLDEILAMIDGDNDD